MCLISPFPNDKLWTRPNRKHFATDKLTVAKKMIFLYGRAEDIDGKGENAG